MNNNLNRRLILTVLLATLSNTALGLDVEDKVNRDLDLYRSFLTTSDAINNHTDADFMTIGADANCDFDANLTSIQTVVDTGVAEVRVAANGTYTENLDLIDQSAIIRGGFVDCKAAEQNDQTHGEFALIDGSAAASPVIRINSPDSRQLIRLENLILTLGTSAVPNFGGGLSVDTADLELQLLRVVIVDNSGPLGAGMYVDAGLGANGVDTNVFAQDLIISNNQSTNLAGGLYCHAGSQVTLTGMSFIGNNQAMTQGGGGYFRNDCEVSFYSEFYPESLSFLAGFVNNESTQEGGGAFVTLGAELYLFGQRMCDDTHCLGSTEVPISVYDNHADQDEVNQASGGGLYLGESSFLTEVYASGLVMTLNSSGGDGGGAYVGENTSFVIERLGGGCWNKDRCNHIIANQSGTSVGIGGGFFVEDGSLSISNAYLEENRADFGTALAASGEETVVTVQTVVFNDNGNNGTSDFSDFQAVWASLGAAISIDHSTLADNDVVNSVFDIGVALDSSLTLTSSIVHDPGSGDLFGPISGDLSIECLVAHESSSYSGLNVLVADPLFVNRPRGDYHLSLDSPAIDLCAGIPTTSLLDIDREPRHWDDPSVPNDPGMLLDAGADESYLSDVIFKNDFE